MRATTSHPALGRKIVPIATLALALVLGLAVYTFAASLSIDNKVEGAVNAFHVGGTVTYTERVTNTNLNPATLTVEFTYPNGTSEVLDAARVWAIGESRTYTRTYVVSGAEPVVLMGGAERFSSELHAYGREAGTGDRIDLRASKSSQMLKPAITVSTTVDFNGDGTFGELETYYAGVPARWKIVVTNTGDCALTTSMSDLTGYDFGAAFTLAPGEWRTFLVDQALGGDFTNIATATGTDVVGGVVSATDSAAVAVVRPALTVSKTVEYTDPDSIFTDLEVGVAGGTATWKVVITNTGDSALTGVSLTDSNGHDFGGAITLAAGEVREFTYGTAVTADVTDTVSVTALDVLGGAVGPHADSAAVDVIRPALAVKKYVEFDGDGVYSDESEDAPAGSHAYWRIVVTNTGDVPLANVQVADTVLSKAFSAPTLGVGESTTFEYNSATRVTLANTATVTATGPAGTSAGPVIDAATAQVILPAALTIKKYVSFDNVAGYSDTLETGLPGTDAAWRIMVANTGQVRLENIRVTDTNGQSWTIPSLEPGKNQWFVYTTPRVVEDVFNVATAEADVADGRTVGPVSDYANALVSGPLCSVKVQKFVEFDGDGVYSDGAEAGYLGSTAKWRIVVTNDGEANLSNVYVRDSNGRTWTIPLLLAGESKTFEYSTIVNGPLRNTVTVKAKTPNCLYIYGDPDSAVIDPGPWVGLQVRKYIDFNGDGVFSDISETNVAGATATWRVVVTNQGQAPVKDIRLRDSQWAGKTIPLLGVGESMTFEYTNRPTCSFTNLAYAYSKAPSGADLPMASDTATAIVVGGYGLRDVSVKKYVDFDGDGVYSDDTEWGVAGTEAKWRITVTNNHKAATVSRVTVVDFDGSRWTLTNILPGETRTVDYSEIITLDYTNYCGGQVSSPNALYMGTVYDSATAKVKPASVTIEKQVRFGDACLFTPEQTGYAGSQALWRIIVKNTGETDLYNVVVNDSNGKVFTIGFMARGATKQFDYFELITGEKVNTATVTATTIGGVPVEPRTAWASVKVHSGAVAVQAEESVDFNGDGIFSDLSENGPAGGIARWRAEVHNTGDYVLYDIVVRDVFGAVHTIAELAPGAEQAFESEGVVANTTVNTLTVTARGPSWLPLPPATDDAAAIVGGPVTP